MIRGEGSCSSLELGAEALGMNCRGPQDQTLDLDAIIKAPKQKLQVFLLALEVLLGVWGHLLKLRLCLSLPYSSFAQNKITFAGFTSRACGFFHGHPKATELNIQRLTQQLHGAEPTPRPLADVPSQKPGTIGISTSTSQQTPKGILWGYLFLALARAPPKFII